MKAKELIEKLGKLIELKPDANVFFYASNEDAEFIDTRLIEGKHLSDIGLVLSRTYQGGEGLISIDTESEIYKTASLASSNLKENINDLTPEDAEAVAIAILPTVNKWISTSMFKRAGFKLSDIANIIPSVKRAGATPDTYCKIATAMLKHGIATDLRKDRNSNMSLSFRAAKPKDKPPSLEICSARWEMIKRLDFEDIKRLEFEENEIDNLSQKDAEAILKELTV